jgi:3-keto-L-gulonate-6-phosphate decarboxylase
MAESRKGSKGSAKGTAAAVCPVALCPVGMFLSVTGDVRPEALDHLLRAGRELMMAGKAIIEARADEVREPAKLHRIDVQ